MKALALLILLVSYPDAWWAPVDETLRYSWEILPQQASREKNEVILSKRTELGVFSNFAATPFVLDNKSYASIEGYWQMMKYPDPTDPLDTRNEWADEYPYTREEVSQQTAFVAKEAGDKANAVNKIHKINWYSYNGVHFNAKDKAEGSQYHYELIKRASLEKVNQNPEVKELLLRTGTLILRPDHIEESAELPAYQYYNIMMEIRSSLQTEAQ